MSFYILLSVLLSACFTTETVGLVFPPDVVENLKFTRAPTGTKAEPPMATQTTPSPTINLNLIEGIDLGTYDVDVTVTETKTSVVVESTPAPTLDPSFFDGIDLGPTLGLSDLDTATTSSPTVNLSFFEGIDLGPTLGLSDLDTATTSSPTVNLSFFEGIDLGPTLDLSDIDTTTTKPRVVDTTIDLSGIPGGDDSAETTTAAVATAGAGIQDTGGSEHPK
ncbi:hypothetical protein Pmar_PMAR015329 [Perkinsus marinus ATCC 50983]|uniref:Uncharacterized protein n=1 Tax=Perkinsus marinus (strain ATCC 50983 / TXsc) TaxID=423536 RepID=C5KLB1_PERM5|nr:hypothetical protein Pmar_PMAR015329 [Perkinsus marinus ATCC 50983]EER14784.1 hypothetical protein Pmar_PMAR015329 [Perkinsus marinus ATCC 50983]|eukprot:XP_002782988.1 hypothetical protein Pmar_PMAR015329 [Perkinsus marinus ATCC 50983]